MKRVLQIDGKDKVKNGKGVEVKRSEGLGEIGVIPSICHVDVLILDGHSIDGVLKWLEYWNAIKGVEFRLQLAKDQFRDQEMVDNHF